MTNFLIIHSLPMKIGFVYLLHQLLSERGRFSAETCVLIIINRRICYGAVVSSIFYCIRELELTENQILRRRYEYVSFGFGFQYFNSNFKQKTFHLLSTTNLTLNSGESYYMVMHRRQKNIFRWLGSHQKNLWFILRQKLNMENSFDLI